MERYPGGGKTRRVAESDRIFSKRPIWYKAGELQVVLLDSPAAQALKGMARGWMRTAQHSAAQIVAAIGHQWGGRGEGNSCFRGRVAFGRPDNCVWQCRKNGWMASSTAPCGMQGKVGRERACSLLVGRGCSCFIGSAREAPRGKCLNNTPRWQ